MYMYVCMYVDLIVTKNVLYHTYQDFQRRLILYWDSLSMRHLSYLYCSTYSDDTTVRLMYVFLYTLT